MRKSSTVEPIGLKNVASEMQTVHFPVDSVALAAKHVTEARKASGYGRGRARAHTTLALLLRLLTRLSVSCTHRHRHNYSHMLSVVLELFCVLLVIGSRLCKTERKSQNLLVRCAYGWPTDSLWDEINGGKLGSWCTKSAAMEVKIKCGIGGSRDWKNQQS